MLRVIMDISAYAISLSDGPRADHSGHQCSHTPGRPILHLRLILSQTSAGLFQAGEQRPRPAFRPSALAVFEFDHLKLLPVMRPIRVAAANLCSWCEQAFARNMINLQPRAVRILEQHRVVAGGKTVVSRCVNDMCADFYKEVICLVDIGTFSRTKTVMMQTHRALTKSLPNRFPSGGMDAEPCTAADTVKGVGGVSYNRQAKKRQ